MKGTISFAEIRALQSHLRKYEGGFIEKNYYGNEGVSFKLRKSGTDSTYLHFIGNNYLFLARENRIEGKKNFLPLENVAIERIKQIGTDRILEIEGSKNVVIEMMGGGNLVIVQDGMIIYSMKQLKRRVKSLKVGEQYQYPDFIDLQSVEFDMAARIRESKSDPVRTLATRLGLSKYAEEILCALKTELKDNEELMGNLSGLKGMISLLLKEAEKGSLYVYDDEFYVWRSFCKNYEPEKVGIFEGLQRAYEEGRLSGENKNEAIMRNVTDMKKEAEKYRNIGELIMSNLNEVNLFIEGARKGEYGIDTDYDKGIVKFRADDFEIPLRLNLSAGDNADNYFKMSKRIRDRLSRVKLEPVKKEIRKPKKEVKRIFTNYRWFITSDGNLVLAGKDAGSNDSVVKKYLGEKDLYFHADIRGAPSVVMKVSNTPTINGIEEVASFAWCMSKAWNANFGNGSVYYVTKSQVSKTPESGEYLARGAWIIRGKKNFITHLDLELAVGFQSYERREYVVSCPPSSLEGRKVIIGPGEGKEEVVKEISDFLGVERESIYPVLPPGEWEIKEKIDS